MAINFSTNDRWIRASSSTNYYQNGATSQSTTTSTQSIGFYATNTEHVRFDDYGIVTNIYGAPAIVLRKSDTGATANQNPVPVAKTIGSLPTYDVRNNMGSRSSQNSFLAPVTGIYRISVSSLIVPSAVLSLIVNGSQWYNGIHAASMGLSYLTMAVEYIRSLNAGDHVQLYSWNSGGVYGDNGWTTLTVSYVG